MYRAAHPYPQLRILKNPSNDDSRDFCVDLKLLTVEYFGNCAVSACTAKDERKDDKDDDDDKDYLPYGNRCLAVYLSGLAVYHELINFIVVFE